MAIPELSAKILMNLWIFASNAYGGDPKRNTYPMTATYDYFRFYKSNTDTKYPCAPYPACVAGTPASHPDNILSKNNPNDGVPYYAN